MFIIRLSSGGAIPLAVMLWGIGVILAICVVFFVVELITDAIARRRYKKFRKGYVDLRNYED